MSTPNSSTDLDLSDSDAPWEPDPWPWETKEESMSPCTKDNGNENEDTITVDTSNNTNANANLPSTVTSPAIGKPGALLLSTLYAENWDTFNTDTRNSTVPGYRASFILPTSQSHPNGPANDGTSSVIPRIDNTQTWRCCKGPLEPGMMVGSLEYMVHRAVTNGCQRAGRARPVYKPGRTMCLLCGHRRCDICPVGPVVVNVPFVHDGEVLSEPI